MEKTYDPKEVETRWYREWEEAGAFSCADTRGEVVSNSPFTIVIPPPNVTGSLHIGHALNNTLQDILARYHRMRGYDVLWQPGMDHAGIATQMVVERQLEESGVFLARGNQNADENDSLIGREEFVEKVWSWKAESGGTILNQLRRLGASCDWSRERFTMDAGLSEAVQKVFVALYQEGLIYRDKRLVNWDPKFHTAISDLEVEQREVVGSLWYFRYPLTSDNSKYITVATTRPETMLGDTAVAVNPDDPRFTDLIGESVLLPIANRLIPIIADEYSDPGKGSGAVKITPAHDFNDFEVGKRHNLPIINIFDPSGRLNDNVPDDLKGMDRFDARTKIVTAMEELGLLERIEDNPMTVPYGDRSGVVIEPRLTDQWFIDAEALSKKAIEVVESGETCFVPKHWENTYFDWMRNIQPWCISRQIWWGHRIPAWYGPDGEVFVAESEEEAAALALNHYNSRVILSQDEDVLDTWFSSALWPFSTLGWPKQDELLDRHYPTNVLVTGFDIIFFWVARMMMMGLKFQEKIPFQTVYIHALVRDENGQKMSKSKGNVLDPLDLIDSYGADALRFTLAALAAQGRDIKLSSARIEGYRNFITKFWNAARYAEINGCKSELDFDPNACTEVLNRWIIKGVAETEKQVTQALNSFRFNDAAQAIYGFTWHTFCDWYLEFTKPILSDGESDSAMEVRRVTGWVIDRITALLHPFSPFVTEEIWQSRCPENGSRPFLDLSAWPSFSDQVSKDASIDEIDWAIELISSVRAIRSELNVPANAKVPLYSGDITRETEAKLLKHHALIQRLARLEKIAGRSNSENSGVQIVVRGETYFVSIDSAIDVGQEKIRLQREIDKVSSEISKIENKLSNQNFLSKAPEEVVEENRSRLEQEQKSREKLLLAFDRLSAL
jgi:valyl-tRNA synthetase